LSARQSLQLLNAKDSLAYFFICAKNKIKITCLPYPSTQEKRERKEE
jgi:hypothetical protein